MTGEVSAERRRDASCVVGDCGAVVTHHSPPTTLRLTPGAESIPNPYQRAYYSLVPTTASRAAARSLPFEIRRSSIQGRGAFATRRIRTGQRVIEYTGEHITPDEGDARYEEDGMGRHHTFLFTLDDDTVVDGARGGNEARFINHSCDPNCEAVIEKGHIWIYAKRPIAPGEELTYDYQYERFDWHTPEDEAFYACRCGAAKCRGSILKTRRGGKKTGVKSGAKDGKKSGSAKKGGAAKRTKTTAAKRGAKRATKAAEPHHAASRHGTAKRAGTTKRATKSASGTKRATRAKRAVRAR